VLDPLPGPKDRLFEAKLDGLKRTGTTMKVNLALDRLPTFTCLPENRGQHNGTIHLLPQERDVIGHVRAGFEKVQAGELAEFPTIEWYIHTQADPSLKDDRGRHNAAFFVQWVPYELSGGRRWDDEEPRERIWETIRTEFERTVHELLLVCGEERLLQRSPVLRDSIDRRNPYVDPLSFLQVELLRRVRRAPDDDEQLGRVTLTTLNGIAGGLRSTG